MSWSGLVVWCIVIFALTVLTVGTIILLGKGTFLIEMREKAYNLRNYSLISSGTSDDFAVCLHEYLHNQISDRYLNI